MAGRAGGRPIVDTSCPGAAGRIKIVFTLVGVIQRPVLGFLINFDLGMVGAQMALVAGFRHAGFRNRKAVTGVTGRAGALAAIGVDATDTGIGPGVGIDVTVFVDFNYRAVAVEAPGFAFIIGVHSLVQPGIEFPDNLDGVGMLGAAVLGDFVRDGTGNSLWASRSKQSVPCTSPHHRACPSGCNTAHAPWRYPYRRVAPGGSPGRICWRLHGGFWPSLRTIPAWWRDDTRYRQPPPAERCAQCDIPLPWGSWSAGRTPPGAQRKPVERMTKTSDYPFDGIFLIYQPPFVLMVEFIHQNLYAKFFNPQAFGLIGQLAILTVHDGNFVIVDQIIMAVDALFLVARPSIYD